MGEQSSTESEYKLGGYRFSASDAFLLHLACFAVPLLIGTIVIEVTLSNLRSLYFAIPFTLVFGTIFLTSFRYNIGTGTLIALQRNTKGKIRLTTKRFFGKRKISQTVSYVIDPNGGSVWLSGPGQIDFPLFSAQGADGDQEVRLFVNAMEQFTKLHSQRKNL